jgi:hypothetical protein
VDGGQGAFQAQGFTQFGQGHVGFALQMPPDGDAVLGHDALFAPSQMVARLDAAGLAPLLQEFFDHAKRDTKAPRDLIASAFTLVIRADDALT